MVSVREESVWVPTLFVLLLTLFYFLAKKVFERRRRRLNNNDPQIVKSGHHWTPQQTFEWGFYCSMCEAALTSGYECELCLLRVDELTCVKAASQELPCKTAARNAEARVLKHHWVRGNLGSSDFCVVCDELCGDGAGLTDYRCAWCGWPVHADCRRKLTEKCTRGAARTSIIPPNCVSLRKGGSRNQKQLVVDRIVRPDDVAEWRPVIVIVNPKSGSGAGAKVLRAFRSVLHPVQVVDVTKSNMKTTLRWLDENEDVEARIVIAGGDGTISLCLDEIDNLKKPPPVAILPLGTGNDLSRVLGWGKDSDGSVSATKLLQRTQDSQVQDLDRWRVHIENARKLGVRLPNRNLSMTNYVSVGVDARVTLGMQNTRSSLPRVLSSRFINKFLFFTFGTKDIFERACRGLESRIELVVDDVKIELPQLEGLIFLNIPCWGAGVKVWHNQELMPQKIDDGVFEIFAVRSSFHIAQLQVGFSEPMRLAQGRKATLTISRGPLPMQSDGEAWLQGPCTITIDHKCVSKMLRTVKYQ